jgi:hypothetical protein
MSRINVDATTRWASGTDQFQRIQIMVMLSVTDDAGAPVTGLDSANVFVRYVQGAPEDGSLAATADYFHEYQAGFPKAAGFYSFVISPYGEVGDAGFAQDQIFLLITIQQGAHQGQAICLATYNKARGG